MNRFILIFFLALFSQDLLANSFDQLQGQFQRLEGPTEFERTLSKAENSLNKALHELQLPLSKYKQLAKDYALEARYGARILQSVDEKQKGGVIYFELKEGLDLCRQWMDLNAEVLSIYTKCFRDSDYVVLEFSKSFKRR